MARKTGKRRASRRNPSPAQRAARAKFAAMARSRSRAARKSNPAKRRRPARRANPSGYIGRSPGRHYRKSNPAPTRAYRRARRRNPIRLGGGLTNLRSYIAPMKDAAIMGAGAVAVDFAYGYIARYLPARFQAAPGVVSLGSLVKAVITVALGKVLAGPTKGLSQRAAMGALIVQARDMALAFMPPKQAAQAAAVNGLRAFGNPAMVVPGNARANAYTRPGGVGGFVRGRSPVLNGASAAVGGFTTGASPLLRTGSSLMAR